MTEKKSTRKKIGTTIRFRDVKSFEKIREAAAIEDFSLNKFIVRAAVAAAAKVLAAHSSPSK